MSTELPPSTVRIKNEGHVYESVFRQSADLVLGTHSPAGVGGDALRISDSRTPGGPRSRAGSGANGTADYLRGSAGGPLLEFGVLSFCLDEYGNIRISVFPHRKEILIRRPRFSQVALKCVGPSQTEP